MSLNSFTISNNIKCVGSTIKCIGFEPIHYAISLDVVSFFMIFSDFDFMFLSMYCYFELIKLFFSSKKKKEKRIYDIFINNVLIIFNYFYLFFQCYMKTN